MDKAPVILEGTVFKAEGQQRLQQGLGINILINMNLANRTKESKEWFGSSLRSILHPRLKYPQLQTLLDLEIQVERQKNETLRQCFSNFCRSWIPLRIWKILYLYSGNIQSCLHTCTISQVHKQQCYPTPPTPLIHAWTPGFKKKRPLSQRTKANHNSNSLFGH